MKKIRGLLTVLFALFFSTTLVSAECDAALSNRLNSLAVNVGYSYEVVELEVPWEEGTNLPDGMTDDEIANYVPKEKYFRIHITNITEDLYVTIRNDKNKEVKTFRFSDTSNGSAYFDALMGDEIVNYTIDVYASEKNDCSSRKLRTMYLTTPKYNIFSEASACVGIEEFYLCHEFLAVDTNYVDLQTATEQYRKGKINADGSDKIDEEKDKSFFEFVKGHPAMTSLVVVVIVAVGGYVTVIIVKKQRSKMI